MEQRPEEIVGQRQEKERAIQVVEQEQNRIRQNMAQLDRTNELYAKCVKNRRAGRPRGGGPQGDR
jgi:hypothetical protein